MAKRKSRNQRRREKLRREREQQNNNIACYQHQQNSAEETPNDENKNNPDGIIVLGVYIHCEGCANQVIKSLRGFEGVEGIEIDAQNHKVTVKGKKADPIKVVERLRKKSGKHVELISPKLIQQVEEEKKPEAELDVFEVVLKVYIHCEGCAKEVKHCIHDMEGVQTVEPNMEENLVTVRGTMDPNKLVEFISKRGGRNAQIVKKIHVKRECENNQEMYYQNYPSEVLYAPQLFSDENPNACSIM